MSQSLKCDLCEYKYKKEVTLNKHINHNHFPSDLLSAVTGPVPSGLVTNLSQALQWIPGVDMADKE